MSGGGGGAGGGLITDANARLLVEGDVSGAEPIAYGDTEDRPIFDWGTDVPPPTIVEGDAISLAITYQHLEWGESVGSYSGSTYIEGPEFGPSLYPTSAIFWAYSWAGWHNIPFHVTPCGFGPGAFGGWSEREIWLDLFVVPEHPADLAGIYLDIDMGAGQGAATNANVMVLDSAPTVGRQGFVIATIPPSATTRVLVPASRVPAEGGHLWVGIGPSWQADYASFGAQCATEFQNPVLTGQYGSGRIAVNNVTAAAFATYSDPGGDLGTTPVNDDENDPHEGGNTIIDFGTEGSPTTEVSGGAFRVTGPGGRCLGVVGDREDEEEPAGVWGDPFAAGMTFEVSAIGDGPGLSHIEVTTTRPGLTTVGTVHLGDSTRAPGISVTVGSTTVYQAVSISTGEVWAARFDDRSECEFRGKLWLVADGEPTDWNVTVDLPTDGTEDVLDRIVVCVRADTSQTVTLYPVTGAASAPGSWIREKLGVASGTTDRFPTSHLFHAGTLRYLLSGVAAPPVHPDEARLDYQPTAGMTVWAEYLTE